jgi:hypothetical protein
MRTFTQHLAHFLRDEDGPTARAVLALVVVVCGVGISATLIVLYLARLAATW